MKKTKKLLLTLLLAVLVAALLAMEFTAAAETGMCGDNLTWSGGGTLLHITGSGPMWNYTGVPGDEHDVPDYSSPTLKTINLFPQVTSIGDRAFMYCPNVQTVTFDRVITIGDYAFASCSKIKSISLSSTLISIGDYAFMDCSGLKEIIIPNNLTSIGDGAFMGCTALKGIRIPDTVTAVGASAFSGCNALTDIYYAGSEEQWNSIQADNEPIPDVTVHYNTLGWGYWGTQNDDQIWILNGEGLLTVSGTGTMQDYKWKGPHAPWYSLHDRVLSAVVEDGVKSIGQFAFDYCRNMTEITIAGSVKRIRGNAFSSCTALESVILQDGVETLDSGAFLPCDSLRTIALPKSLSSLEGSSLPLNLDQIIIDENSEALSLDAFGCLFNKDKTKLIRFPNGGNEMSYTIPDSVTGISKYAFYDCESLTDVSIPDGVTSIDYDAFYNCKGLLHATIPDSVTTLGGGILSNCSALTSVTLSRNLTSIPGGAFENCSSLTSIAIPDGVTSIGRDAFHNCTNLAEISVPNTIFKIEEDAFYRTAWLNAKPDGMVYAGKVAYQYKGTMPEHMDLVLIDDCTGIANEAFYYKTGLESIVIPNSVTYLGEDAFFACSGLKSIVLGNGIMNIPASIFRGCNSLTDLYVSSEAHWNMVSVDYFWNEPLETVTIHFDESIGLITVISEGYCGGEGDGTNLSYSLSIDGVLTISGTGAMTDTPPWSKYMRYIKELKIGEGVTTIGYGAFWGAPLGDVVLPDGITTIADYAFICYIRSIRIPESLTSVGYYAFGESGLQTVYYAGTEEQWTQISIAQCNELFIWATIYYNFHDHTPAAPVRENEVPASCTENGGYDEVVYCTRCTYEFSRNHVESPALGHSWGEWVVVKQATTEETGLMRRTCRNDASHVEEREIPKLELDENNEPTGPIQAFVESITGFFRGFIDWFLRLFRR